MHPDSVRWIRFQSLLLWNGGADNKPRERCRAGGPGFNPCCCGTGGRTTPAKAGPAGARKFQSLLLWNGGADHRPRPARRRPGQVSILVVVERGGGRGGAIPPPPAHHLVSILVVVERGGGADGGCSLARCLPGFNPCCCGTGGRTFGDHCRTALPVLQVSILVVVERGGGESARQNAVRGAIGFQSLLLWNGGADPAPHSHVHAIRDRVSILVVVERGGGHRPWRWAVPTAVSWFQSLLLWNGGADRGGQDEVGGSVAGFNPCCCGTGEADIAGWPGSRFPRQVSILVVVERGGGPGGQDKLAEVSPVSILVVVERGGGPRGPG